MLRYPVATAKRCFPLVRAIKKRGTFVRQGENWCSDNCRVVLKAVMVSQPVTCGQATGITGGIRLSDWYYKYIRELKHMSSYM